MLVHGDDFVATGPKAGLSKFRKLLEAHCECKVESIGPGPDDAKELRVRGRMICFTKEGLRYEPDPRHVEAVVRDLGLEEAKPTLTLWAREADGRSEKGIGMKELRERVGDQKQLMEKKVTFMETNEGEEALDPDEKTVYMSLSARLNYLSPDRPDVTHSATELMRSMPAPMRKDMERLKRVARYLVGCPRVCQFFPWQKRSNRIRAYADADFAGCKRTRKSTSGGCVMWGDHMLKH